MGAGTIKVVRKEKMGPSFRSGFTHGGAYFAPYKKHECVVG